jgi:hypothetical protein
MRTPDAIRQRRTRRRRRLGLRMVPVEVSEGAVELLEKRGYEPRRDGACGSPQPERRSEQEPRSTEIRK